MAVHRGHQLLFGGVAPAASPRPQAIECSILPQGRGREPGEVHRLRMQPGQDRKKAFSTAPRLAPREAVRARAWLARQRGRNDNAHAAKAPKENAIDRRAAVDSSSPCRRASLGSLALSGRDRRCGGMRQTGDALRWWSGAREEMEIRRVGFGAHGRPGPKLTQHAHDRRAMSAHPSWRARGGGAEAP